MPIAHVSIPVTNLKTSLDFYLAALKPLGYFEFQKFEVAAGLTVKNAGPDFWITQCPEIEKEGGKVAKSHVAFEGKSHTAVKGFYEAALAAGAKDNGPPGERPQYTKGYYAAFVLDPDGHNIECVYYQPLWLSALQVAPSIVGGLFVAGVSWYIGRKGSVFA